MTAAAHADEPKEPAAGGDWIQIFNGRDLTGWTPKINGYPAGENYADTFRVEDGVLRVSYDKYDGEFNGRFGHLFYKEPLSHYALRVEYRIVGEQAPGGESWALRNSGIMYHGQSPRSMSLDQRFPVSLEYQMLAGNGTDPRHTGNLCTPGTHFIKDGELVTQHCNESTSKTYAGDQWVTAEIEVHGGNRIIHRVNGETIFEFTDPQLDPKDADAKRLLEAGAALHVTSGTISLQSESHPIEFRKVELMRLEE
jgi:hypothetical protein